MNTTIELSIEEKTWLLMMFDIIEADLEVGKWDKKMLDSITNKLQGN